MMQQWMTLQASVSLLQNNMTLISRNETALFIAIEKQQVTVNRFQNNLTPLYSALDHQQTTLNFLMASIINLTTVNLISALNWTPVLPPSRPVSTLLTAVSPQSIPISPQSTLVSNLSTLVSTLSWVALFLLSMYKYLKQTEPTHRHLECFIAQLNVGEEEVVVVEFLIPWAIILAVVVGEQEVILEKQ